MLGTLWGKRVTRRASTPVFTATAWLGDSITAALGEKSIADWTNYFLSGLLLHPVGYNQGVAGNQTSDMIARQATGLALTPALYMVLGGTNDIVVGGKTAAAIQANLQTIINTAFATASVQKLCIRTITKRNDAGFTANPAFATVRNDVNTWIKALSDPRIIIVDYDASTFDPSVHTVDGLHPNQAGALILGEFTAAALASNVPAGDVLADETGNLIVNASLSGTTGGKTSTTGSVATSWQVRNFVSGFTAVASKGTVDGTNASQIIVLNGTAAADSFVDFTNAITYSGQAGDVYEAVADFKITNGTGLGTIRVVSDGVITFSSNVVTSPANRDLGGIVRTGRAALAGTDTSNTFTMSVHFAAGTTVTNLTITISRPRWRKVN